MVKMRPPKYFVLAHRFDLADARPSPHSTTDSGAGKDGLLTRSVRQPKLAEKHLMKGSPTAQDCPRTRIYRPGSCCLPHRLTASASRISDFAAQWLTRRFPLSTLQRHPRERLRMTRGRNDLLHLFRVELHTPGSFLYGSWEISAPARRDERSYYLGSHRTRAISLRRWWREGAQPRETLTRVPAPRTQSRASCASTGLAQLVSFQSPHPQVRPVMPGSASLSGGALLCVTTLGRSRMR